jgi:hypothetical protein
VLHHHRLNWFQLVQMKHNSLMKALKLVHHPIRVIPNWLMVLSTKLLMKYKLSKKLRLKSKNSSRLYHKFMKNLKKLRSQASYQKYLKSSTIFRIQPIVINSKYRLPQRLMLNQRVAKKVIKVLGRDSRTKLTRITRTKRRPKSSSIRCNGTCQEPRNKICLIVSRRDSSENKTKSL